MQKYFILLIFLIGCKTSSVTKNKGVANAKKEVPIILNYLVNKVPPNKDFSDHYYFEPLKKLINALKPNVEIWGLMDMKRIVSENMDIKATSEEMIKANGDAIKMKAALDKSLRQFNSTPAFAKSISIRMFTLNQNIDSIAMQFCGYPSKTIYPTYNFGFIKLHEEPELEFIIQKLDSCLRVTNFLN